MDQQPRKPKPKNKAKGGPKKRSTGYTHRSPAVCVTVYDISGRAMSDSDATDIVNSISEIAMQRGYVINFTRT